MKTGGDKKLDIRVQKTYAKLYKAFHDLLSVRPYESITVLEICEATGIHRATFYKHFVDKQDFVNFCIKHKLDELNFKNNESLFEGGGKAYYIGMCESIIDFITQNKELLADFNFNTSSYAFSEALENAVSDYLERRLKVAASRGAVFVSQIHLLSRYYAGALVALLKAWAYDWDKYSKEDILNFISKRYDELEYSYKHNPASQKTDVDK